MLMISHARESTRPALTDVITPEPTESWRPVPHSAVVNTLIDRAGARGLKIKSERYALMDGTLYPRPGEQVALRGAHMFGSLDFEAIPGMPFPAGMTPSCGVRNSNDKSFALSILSGARVFVCANGVLSAEHVISRKHTSGIDLAQSIDQALDAFMDSIRGFNEIHKRLCAWKLCRTTARSLVIEAAKAGAFASSDILPVLQEYETPSHPEFAERNGWSLYNAATSRMKTQSPGRQAEGFKSLNAVMLSQFN
jgi:hypothetical protein